MSGINDTVADLKRSYLLASVVNALPRDSIADLEYKLYNVVPGVTIADAKKLMLSVTVPGATVKDTLPELERKEALNYFALTESTKSTNDLVYARYKGLAP